MTHAHEDVLEALPVAIYRTDAEGRLTFFNDAAADLWGFRPALGAKTWYGELKALTIEGKPLTPEETPIGISLRTGRPVRGMEVVLVRPDGERIPTMPYPTPLKDSDGKIIGAVILVIDLRDQQRARADTERLAAIVSSSDDAIVSKTLGGVITSWNASAERIFGYTAEEMIGQSILKLIPPDLHDEEKVIIAKISAGERMDHFETVRVGKDGRRIDVSLTVSPLRDPGGAIVGASKVARDVSDRKRAEEMQRLLLDELNHRIKNTLATVQAIAGQTLRRSSTPAEFVTSFNGRIQALSRAHRLLTGSSFQGAEVDQLVRDQLLLGGADDQRITASGPSLMLEAQAALHLALVLHELGTNARKHGALSAPTGNVVVRWEVHTNGGRTLLLKWTESGGPPVKAPSSRGFGTMLIEQSLQAHSGEVTMSYAETGVSCSIRLPLPELPQAALGPFARPAGPLSMVQPPEQPHVLSGKRILVVEDEPLIGMVLVDYLEEAGCKVIGPAQSLEKAKQLVASEAFDAALVDGNLAGRAVDDVAVGLTQKGVPFAFVTGYGREALPAAFQDGIIVEKPFTQEQVVSALERLLLEDRDDNVVKLRPQGQS
ncbi:PAS domain S-box protein [Terricaulis sp.]|uniref:PAS domain S-box protein n=1 Tax=Terricaulis sp. TaxID=2768686 RepID=UPI00378338DA